MLPLAALPRRLLIHLSALGVIASLGLTAGSASAAPTRTPAAAPQIAYFSWNIKGGEPTSQEDIFTVDPTTSKISRITNDMAAGAFISDRDPAWSPDRTRLAIFRDSTGGESWLVLLDARTGRTLRTLTQGMAPHWYDANTLLFLRINEDQRDENGDVVGFGSDVYAVDLTTLAVTRVTAFGPWISVNGMSWHPTSGLAIGYHETTSDWADVRTSVAVLPAAAVNARLAAGPSSTGYLTPADLTFLTPPEQLAYSPDWAPNGTTLAFGVGVPYAAAEDPTYLVPQSEVVVMSVPSGVTTQITDDSTPSDPRCSWGEGAALQLVPCDDDSPTWSPDGTQLAYAHGQEDEWREVRIYTVATGLTRELTGDRAMRFKGALDW
jgi:TolB protein